jgi:ankyrin repeat protein
MKSVFVAVIVALTFPFLVFPDSRMDANDRLCALASQGNLPAIKELSSNKVLYYNAKNTAGTLPIIEASRSGSLDVVEFLHTNKARIDERGLMGETALMAAAASGQLPIIKFLLANGADYTLKDRSGNTAQKIAGARGHVAVRDVLEAHTERELATLLLLESCGDGNVRDVSRMLSAGVDVNKPDRNGMTALMLASATGNIKLARLLIDKGADVDAVSTEGFTAIYGAVKNRRNDVVRLLFKRCPFSGFGNSRALSVANIAEAVGDREIVELVRARDDQLDFANDDASETKALAERRALEAARDRGDITEKECEIKSMRTFTLKMDHNVPPKIDYPNKPEYPDQKIRLDKTYYITDSVTVHKQLWVAAALDNDGNFDGLFDRFQAQGRLRVVPTGTSVIFSGRANGMIAEVTVPSIPGKWYIPVKALDAAGIPRPPVDATVGSDQ